MDKPCPGSSSEVNIPKPASPSPSPAQPSTGTGQAQTSHPIVNHSGVDPNKKYQRYEPPPSRPLSQYDIEKINAGKKAIERMRVEMTKLCQEGDQKMCEQLKELE